MGKKRRFRFPILIKTIILAIVLGVVLIEVGVTYYALTISKKNQESFNMMAQNLSETTVQVLNVDDVKDLKSKVVGVLKESPTRVLSDYMETQEWEDYIAPFAWIQEDPVFLRTREKLRAVANANDEYADCVYISYVDFDYEQFIYLVDSAEEDACPPGCIDRLEPVNYGLLDDPTIGLPPYSTDYSQYGRLVSAGSPIFDGDDVIAYAMVDVSMETVRTSQASSIVRLFFYLLITFNVLLFITVLIMYFMFVKPIKKLTAVALSYDSDEPQLTHDKFVNLNIKSRDEIGDLSESIKKMENDITDKIQQLTKVNEQLLSSREQAKKMTILANKDGLTGVQNKVAYDNEVARLDEEIKDGVNPDFGIVMIDLNYLKNTNDEFGHDIGDVVLIKLSSIICQVFAHSPVYRIGGDEFVVIVRGKDYEKIDKLVARFNKKIASSLADEEIPVQERVSAAIGYSVFAKGDTAVHEIFKRADRAMYARKHEMKDND